MGKQPETKIHLDYYGIGHVLSDYWTLPTRYFK